MNSRFPREPEWLVHGIFREKKKKKLRIPEAPAITAWDGSLTYSGLDDFSSRLAEELRTAYAVGPEAIVTLILEKSVWDVMAIPKAGGTFFSLDPSYQASRRKKIIRAAECKL